MTILRSATAYGAVLAILSLAACGGGDETGTTTTTTSAAGGAGGAAETTGTGAGFQTGAHGAMPQVVSLGGAVLKAPKVQPIVYASDPHAADVDAFLAELKSTPYWGQVTSEYGVGAITVLPTIKRTDAAPAQLTDADLTDELASQTSGVSPPWGAAAPDTIYLFVLPEGTAIDAGGLCCDSFDGYHDEASVNGVAVPYAVACTCPGIDGPDVNDLQQVTVVISHELVEAATDPFPESSPGFAQTDDADLAWTIATGGEVADMCQYDDDAFVIPPGAKYMVQKSWSNAAAKAGKEPCLPATAGAPFFGAAPVLPDQVTISGYPGVTSGVKVPIGQTRTIDVQLFSDQPTSGPWTVTAYDLSSDFYGDSPALELSLDKTTGQNGDVLKLTIKSLSLDGSLGADVFVLESTQGNETSLFMGTVSTK